MAKNNKKAKTGNTFYREAITGGMAKEPYTLKKFGQHAFKGTKYATFGFLAVTAIWGCVDGFRIKTNPLVSRGMEVYMTDDDVISSTYATAPETGYRIEGAEINPFYFDEENFVTDRDQNGKPITTPTTDEEMYMSVDSEITVKEIRDYKWSKADAIQEHKWRKGDETSPFVSKAAVDADNSLAKQSAKILPFTVINPAMSRATNIYFNEDENLFGTPDKWQSFTGGNTANVPYNYSSMRLSPTDEGYIDPSVVAPHWQGGDGWNYDLNTTHAFNEEDQFINLTELSNPFNIHGEKNAKGFYGDKYGFTRKEFVEGTATPHYLKQFTTSNQGVVNMISNMDFTTNTMLENGYLSGANKGTNPTLTYGEEGNTPGFENSPTAINYNSTDLLVETGTNTGVETSTSQKMLNSATWTQTEYEKWTQNFESDDAWNVVKDDFEGVNIFRSDAIKKGMNTLSFLTGKQVTWNTSTVDGINLIDLIQFDDLTPEETKIKYPGFESGIEIWVNSGSQLQGVTGLENGNRWSEVTSYDVNIMENIEVFLNNINGVNDVVTPIAGEQFNGVGSTGITIGEYLSNSKVVFGTSLFTTGHQPKEGFQVTPTEATLRYAINDRGTNWKSLDRYGAGGKDTSIINAGYTMMDQDGMMVKLGTQTELEELAKTDSNLLTKNGEQEYFNSYGANGEKAGLTARNIDNKKGDAFKNTVNPNTLEQIRNESLSTIADYNQYALVRARTRDQVDVTFNMTTVNSYIGMSSMLETGFFSGQDINGYDHTGVSDINHSIEGAGNNAYNEDRIAMVSWGQAWKLSPFYGAFVWPLSKVAIFVQSWFPSEMGIWGVILGIFLIVFLLRGASTLFNFKGTAKQAKMQEIQFQVQKINAKYARYADNKAMKRRKQMETMALYRKAGVNPMGSIGSIFTTMPVFLSIWTIINSIFIYKTAVMGGVSLAVSPLTGIFNFLTASAGVYIPIAAAVIAVQIISGKLPNWLSQKRSGVKNLSEDQQAAMKKSNRTSTIMTVVFVIMGLTVPALLGVYWMASGLFTIGLNIGQHQWANRKNRLKAFDASYETIFEKTGRVARFWVK